MSKDEIETALASSYSELVKHLLKKYGPAPCDYFKDESCKYVDRRISRSNEGLQCHHIDEDKAIMLSDTRWATKNPFKYQKADRLVYCNVLEHLILHIKIMDQPRKKDANPLEAVGVGGAINYIIPQTNDFYNGYEFKRDYLKKLYEPVADNFDEYIDILKELLSVAQFNIMYERFVSVDKISRGSDGKIVDKIYDRLKGTMI